MFLLGSALIMMVLGVAVPAYAGGRVGQLITLLMVGPLAVLGAMVLRVPHRMPSLFWTLVPTLTVTIIVALDLLTKDASVSGQIFLCLPVLYAAYELRVVPALVVLGEVVVAIVIIQVALVPPSHVMANIGTMTMTMTVIGLLLIRSREREARLVEGLAARERHMRALVAGSSDVITLCDSTGLVRYQSAAATTVFGLTTDDVVGRRVSDLAHPEDGHRLLSALVAARAVDEHAREPVVWQLRDTGRGRRYMETMISDRLDDPDVRALVLHTREITEHLSLQAQLSHRAFHDDLTGLPNRALLRDRMHQALARLMEGAPAGDARIGVLLVDLDGFKAVNDSLGPDDGDTLLVEIAERLTRLVRVGDTLARLGGDEFVLLLESIDGPDRSVRIAERILEEMSRPVLVGGRTVTVSASIGVTVGTSGTTRSDLLRDADLAMRAAKARGGGCVVSFEPGMRSGATRHDLRLELGEAITRGDLVLHYQPVVDLDTGTMGSAEALVRWNHPTRGLLPPAEFIPVAEESGLIADLGGWVLGEAVRQAVAWDAEGTSVNIAVNLSVRQLRTGLAAKVAEVLENVGLTPDRLVLELTESMLIDDTHDGLTELTELRRMGVHLAIDDFGTGYSSLAYLGRLPIDLVKIDRSFVAGLGTGNEYNALTKGILTLGEEFGLTVIAEGIEREDQLSTLRELGCRWGQGYLFAAPAPAAELIGYRASGFQLVSG